MCFTGAAVAKDTLTCVRARTAPLFHICQMFLANADVAKDALTCIRAELKHARALTKAGVQAGIADMGKDATTSIHLGRERDHEI